MKTRDSHSRQILRSRIATAALMVCGWASSGAAQTAVHFDLGGAQARYGDSASMNSGTLGAMATALSPNATFSAAVAASAAAQSSWTGFGAATGSVFSPSFGASRGELHAGGSGSTYGSGPASAQLLGGLRIHLARATAGAWIGAGAGRVKDPIGWRGTTVGELGAWGQAGPAVVQAAVIPVRIAGGLNYTDAEGTIRFAGERLEIAGVAGVRTVIAGFTESASPWGAVNATAWILRSVGITASAGNYPMDPGQDLPAARYVTLGVRIAPKRTRVTTPVLAADVLALSAIESAPAMTVSPADGATRTIFFRAASAERVELMGDFTDWVPVPMQRGTAPGVWSVALPVSSGVHQINVRIDGGAWTVPAGLTPVRDELGGSVGILLVP